MKKANPKSITPLLVAASLAATAPAWAQGNAPAGRAPIGMDAMLQRIDALSHEIEDLKAQVRTSQEKASRAEEDVKALAARPVTPPVQRAAQEGLSRQASQELTNAGEPEGVDLINTPKANLKFYGMIDVGAEALSGKLADKNNAQSVRISNGIVTPHFGLIGNGDLAQGLQGSFNLEGSFAPDNGTSGIGGRLFGRQAWAGLTGRLGTVRLGRQYTAVRMGWEDANPYGTGNQGLRLLDPRISNPRADNSFSYIAKWGPVTAGVNYSGGWDAVNGNSANAGPANSAGADCPGEVPDAKNQCKEWSAGAKYDRHSWGVATAFERLHGGTSATFGGLTSPSKTDTRTVLGGHVQLAGGTKLTAGWIHRSNLGSATPSSNMYWVEGIVPLGGPWFFDGLLGELKYKNSPNKADLLNLRARYVLTKDTTLYFTAAFMDNHGTLALPATASTPAPTPLAGASQTSVIAGVLYKF